MEPDGRTRVAAGTWGCVSRTSATRRAICPGTTSRSMCRRQQAAGALQPRRPYQPWSDILLLAGGGDSTIHQLQVEAIQRYSRGLTFQAEYSWNRSLDNVPIVGGTSEPLQPARRSRQLRSGAAAHLLARLQLRTAVRAGQAAGQCLSGPLGKVIGGWQLAGITYLRSGMPFSVSFQRDAGRMVFGPRRPDPRSEAAALGTIDHALVRRVGLRRAGAVHLR